jgi:nucleotide-binding universal stress UspA family protein
MRILLPVDGSKHCRAAIDFVASRSTLIGKDPTVEIVTVQVPVPARAARVVGTELVHNYHAEEADKLLKPAIEKLARSGLTVSAHYLLGDPGEKISEAAGKSKCDLIVMGSHGHSSLRGLLFGSITHEVMARSEAPILLIRDRTSVPADSLHVGIAVDGSKYGREAIKYVLRHSDLFGAKPQFVLLHVVPDFAGTVMPDMAGMALPAFSEEEVLALRKKAFETAVGPVRKLLAKAKVHADEVCLIGNPGDELSAYAKKKKLDIMVMGSHGHGAFHAAVMGSVATRVTAHTDLPLLLIRKA